LLVGVTQSAAHDAVLPAALREIEMVESILSGGRRLLDGDARRGAVLEALPTSDWVHFACHADSDLERPSRSSLQLVDGALTVEEISRRHTPLASLAFLSACATGRGGTTLIDEAIHMSSAFQLAGYPHVIATLWPVVDDEALTMARHIYTALTTGTAGEPARAVHMAAWRLRADHDGRHPTAWAAHIHSGP
jgi:CHAT domain-containing protein